MSPTSLVQQHTEEIMAEDGAGNAFHDGDDFISFDLQASPGPSRPRQALSASPSPPPVPDIKGKGRAKAGGPGEPEADKARANGNVKGKKSKRRKSPALDDEGDAFFSYKDAEAPWADQVDWGSFHDPAEMLNREVTEFYRYMSPTRIEYETRMFIIESIRRAVKKKWPDAAVTPFGSWQTQLYLPQGDIDLVVTHAGLTESNKRNLLNDLARAMRNAQITDTVVVIAKARVPIIKFVTRHGRFNVDISLNQTNGVAAGKIINQYLDLLPAARPLIMVVKAFLSQRSLNEVFTGGLGSYSVICMVISFLQIHPRLRRQEMDPEENLGTLLLEFFELYGRNFNYDAIGISIRGGGSYFLKRSRGWMKSDRPFMLCIEDPQDRDNDISGGSYGILQVKAVLAGAYELLQAALFEKAENLARSSDRRDANGKRLAPSILKGLVKMKAETAKHRQMIKELHTRRTLQRILSIPEDVDSIAHLNFPEWVAPHDRAAAASNSAPRSQPSSVKRPKRRGTPPVKAIIVDDDEVVSDDSDDDDSPDEDPAVIDVSGSEEGEVIEVPPARAKRQVDRYASVSEDDVEDARSSSSVEDSRYALGKQDKPTSTQRDEDFSESELAFLDTDSESDSSGIVALESPPPPAKKQRYISRTSSPPSQHNGMSIKGRAKQAQNGVDTVAAKDRRAFWAAKARGDTGNIDDQDDFIALE